MDDPTPYPDVNAVLDLLLSNVQTTLGNRFVGMYVHGSLASGDFDPQRSDIDFLVVTADELPDELLPALEAMHAQIAASGLKWAAKLEASYIPRQALRRCSMILLGCTVASIKPTPSLRCVARCIHCNMGPLSRKQSQHGGRRRQLASGGQH